MSKLVLILPGATDFELQGRIHGDLDLPLCPEGQAEIELLGQEILPLGIEVLYTSTCSWALQSAETLAKMLGVKVKKLDKLTNLDHGLWQGMLIDDVKQKQPKVYRQWQEQPDSICPPEGETIDQARQRVESTLAKVFKKHKAGVVGLVVPEPLASLVREYVAGGELGDLWRANCNHGCWSVLEFAVGNQVTPVRPAATNGVAARTNPTPSGALEARG